MSTRWAIRPSDLVDALNDLRPGIVHFSGHGGTAGLLLESSEGGFTHGGWSAPYFDPDVMGAAIGASMTNAVCLVRKDSERSTPAIR